MEANPQTQRAFRQGVVLAVVVAAVVGLALQVTKPGEWLENGAFDVRARWTARPEKADPRIVIIDIDNASFDELQEKLGRWPWPRQVWTEIVRYVRKGQPAAIVFDAAFTGEQKEAPAMDEDFARVLQSSGRTVLGFSFLPTQVTGKDQSSRKDVAAFAAQDSRFGYDLAASEWTSNLPLEKLAHAAAGLGSINSTADDRGVTRREPIYFGYDGRAYPSLGAKTVETATPEIKDGWKLRRNWLGARSLVRGDKSVPVDSEGRVLMLWRGHANLADNPEQKVETYKRRASSPAGILQSKNCFDRRKRRRQLRAASHADGQTAARLLRTRHLHGQSLERRSNARSFLLALCHASSCDGGSRRTHTMEA